MSCKRFKCFLSASASTAETLPSLPAMRFTSSSVMLSIVTEILRVLAIVVATMILPAPYRGTTAKTRPKRSNRQMLAVWEPARCSSAPREPVSIPQHMR